MPKVTVIMPALNVAAYIRECMDSVCNQTLKEIEILFIDAGSTDGTLEIVQEYIDADPRIRIIHSDKKSYGYQMNLGIKEAKGEYVGVVETDDIVRPQMFEVLYKNTITSNPDYVKGMVEEFYSVSDNITLPFYVDSGWFHEIETYGKMVIVPCEMPRIFTRDYFYWTGIYRKDFIKQIKFNETPGAAYQDAGFMFQAYSKAQKAVYIPDVFYLYRQDNMQASTYNSKAFKFFVDEYNYMEQFLDGLSLEWHMVYYERMLNHCVRRFLVMAVSGRFWDEALPEIEELRGRLQKALQKQFLKLEHMGEERWQNLQMFLESPRKIYDYYVALYADKIDNIHRTFDAIGEKAVVIFGGGNWGSFLHALIENRLSGKVLAFCDNQKAGAMLQGIPIITPEEAAKEYSDAVYIITGRRYEQPMREQLLELGIIGENIITYTAGIGDPLLFQL